MEYDVFVSMDLGIRHFKSKDNSFADFLLCFSFLLNTPSSQPETSLYPLT